MWLPFTSRTASREACDKAPFRNDLTHGPAALTTAFAFTCSPPDRRAVQRPPELIADWHSVLVRIRTPRSRASIALATTRRASSTRQSEYAKPCLSRGCRPEL